MAQRAEVRITLRLPSDLYEALKAVAEAEVRSVNGQIELAIREHLNARRPQSGSESGGAGAGAGQGR
jgi:hypothetical protein